MSRLSTRSATLTISQRRILTAFIGSPSDLGPERSAARSLIDEINRVIRDLGWQIDLLGWEDTLPGASRPQELINDDIRRCDLFIGLLWHRWGSPTGRYSSGFEEEYELARELASEAEQIEIWLFLKDIDPDRLADPGEQLDQVLAFRRRVEEQRDVLYKPFSDVDHLLVSLRESLLRYIFRLHANVSVDQTLTPQQPPVVPREGADTPVAGGGQTEQAVATLRNIVDAMTNGTRVEVWEAARLRLTASTVFSSAYSAEAVTAHPMNVLYSSERELIPTDFERTLILRSIVSGWDTVPGWRWARDLGDEQVLLRLAGIAVTEKDERARARAVHMLSYARFSPFDPPLSELGWAERLLKDSSSSVVAAAVDYLAGVLPDANTADILVATLKSDQVELQAKLLRRANPAKAIAILMGSSSYLSDWELRAYDGVAEDADETLLRVGLTDRRAPVRAFALRELARRGVLGLDEIREKMRDQSADVRREAARILIQLTPTNYDEARNAAKQVDPEQPWAEDELIRAAVSKLDSDTLAEGMYLFDVDGDDAYAILGQRGDDRVISRLRSDLEDGFEGLRAESLERLVAQHGEAVATYIAERSADVEQFTLARHAAAGLSVLSHIAEPEDAQLARKFLSSKWDFVRLPAIRILAKSGARDYADTLVSIASDSYGAVKDAAVSALIDIDPTVENGAAVLCNSSDPSNVQKVLLQLLTVDETRATEASRRLLYSDAEPIRRLALAALLHCLDREGLLGLLDEYQSAERYFYDVVVWLDTVLYGPEDLASGFRRHLQAEFRATVNGSVDL
jgi:HEAT repeat protein